MSTCQVVAETTPFGNADPITLAILRWGIGFACLLPTALLLRVRWPPRRDWLAVAVLGLCFFGLFFVLYNIAIGFTTAARASLALATLPLHTIVFVMLRRPARLTLFPYTTLFDTIARTATVI